MHLKYTALLQLRFYLFYILNLTLVEIVFLFCCNRQIWFSQNCIISIITMSTHYKPGDTAAFAIIIEDSNRKHLQLDDGSNYPPYVGKLSAIPIQVHITLHM